MYVDKKRLQEIYNEKSKNSEKNHMFELRVRKDSPKTCDLCGKITPIKGKMFHALVLYTGLIFFFCSVNCLKKWIDKEIDEMNFKSKNMIYFISDDKYVKETYMS